MISIGYEEERKHVTAGLGAHAWTCRICWFLGVIFAVLGAIAAAADGHSSWFRSNKLATAGNCSFCVWYN